MINNRLTKNMKNRASLGIKDNSTISPFDINNTGKCKLGNAIEFIQKSKKDKIHNASTVAANDEQEDIFLRKKNDYNIDTL